MRRQYHPQTFSQKSSSVEKQPRFTILPVIQPKAAKKTKQELPEWKPGGSGRPNPLARLLDTAKVQAKLEIGQPNDKYEQEADRVARNVVQHINSSVSGTIRQTGTVGQKMVEEDELQMKTSLPIQKATSGSEASSELESAIGRARNGGQPLDTNLQQSMGQAMGANFRGVRIHTDSQADRLNQSIQAKAFTTGKDVFFRQGLYQPGSRGGQELIAHELTHVVQQNGEGVQKLSDTREQREQKTITETSQNQGNRAILQRKKIYLRANQVHENISKGPDIIQMNGNGPLMLTDRPWSEMEQFSTEERMSGAYRIPSDNDMRQVMDESAIEIGTVTLNSEQFQEQLLESMQEKLGEHPEIRQAIMSFLSMQEEYSICGRANLPHKMGVLSTLVGYHAFIQLSDNRILEWTQIPTKVSNHEWPQVERRQAPLWKIAHLISSATYRGHGRYQFLVPNAKADNASLVSSQLKIIPKDEPGLPVYLPPYKDCFTHVNNILNDVNEKPISDVSRVTLSTAKGWGLVVATAGGIAYLGAKYFLPKN